MRYLILGIFSMVIVGCASSKNKVSATQIANLKSAVENAQIEIVSDAANPVAFTNTRGLENLLPPGSNLARISLINNPNFFKIKNDSIDLYLPYYGEQQIGGDYTSESGLVFKGVPARTKIEFDSSKNRYNLTYILNANKESLTANLTLFANNTSTLRINSSIRTTIIYYGKWAKLEE
ncbi:DUF4251 domain-containing protein [Polaribacter sp. MED152]|uniref:DUF4251 domain-containing protein n=1 Tax=Polaribacter sp. MED152 TaxID=313598 RepID=UPI000068CD4A|nr:DUF4251 domain-containing protein [Polaribacter sp. MED152]EAQ41485.1 hypothetical protein MED152_02185 [Polaribacter sp. MED152]